MYIYVWFSKGDGYVIGTSCRAWIEVGTNSSQDSSKIGYENKTVIYLLVYKFKYSA